MQPSPPQTEPDPPESSAEPQVAVDVLGGLAMLAIAAFFLLGAGEGTLDWVFPTSLSYGVGAAGIVLVIRGFLGVGERTVVVPPILRGKGVAVAVFILFMVLYVVLIRQVGFWMISAATIFGASAYLAPQRSRRSTTVAGVTAVAVAIVGYLVLEYVFYVPFPDSPWLPF